MLTIDNDTLGRVTGTASVSAELVLGMGSTVLGGGSTAMVLWVASTVLVVGMASTELVLGSLVVLGWI